MESIVTAKVKIERDEGLVETMRVYSKALQFCIDGAWDELRMRRDVHGERVFEEMGPMDAEAVSIQVRARKGGMSNGPFGLRRINRPAMRRFSSPSISLEHLKFKNRSPRCIS